MAIFQDDEAEEGIYAAVVWNKCDAAAGVCMGCNVDIGGDSLGATIKSRVVMDRGQWQVLQRKTCKFFSC